MPEPKKEEIKTPVEESSTLEKKDQTQEKETPPTNNEDDKVTVDKKDFETATKKAEDFDKMIEKNRLEKLNNKEEVPAEEVKPNEDNEAVMQEIKKVNDRLDVRELADRENNLKGAYSKFISENKWANDDEVFAEINKNFDSTGAFSEEQYLKKIEEAAFKAAPEKYKESVQKSADKNALSKKFNINAGGNSGGGSIDDSQISDNQKTKEDKMKDKMTSLWENTSAKGR